MAWAAVVGGAISIGGGLLASGKAKRAAKAAKRDQRAAQARINSIKAQRQAVANPYAGSSDLSGMASDLSGMISNPFAQLGVATQAAEIQMEQSDIALANTLDTLRSTGAGAGGATALAQAALQSKKGISANIEQQEAQNEKLKAQGEASANQQKMSEAQRQQGIAISEGQRMQSNEAAGKQFVFQQNEQRTNADLDRAAGGLDQARANEASANQASASAMSGMIGAVGNIATTAVAGNSAQKVADTNLEIAKENAIGSDRRLKKNITKTGESKSGLNIYSFEYIDRVHGDGFYQGVMSNEVPTEAVVPHADGYDRVDYSKLDVEFKKINNEL